MFSRNELLYFNIFLCILSSQTCWSKLVSAPSLVLYSPGDPEHTDVIIKRVHDDLTLVCELRGDPSQRNYVWTRPLGERSLTIAPREPTPSSILQQTDLQLSDSGQYTCSAPPFSVTKYVLVQTKDTYTRNGRITLLGADLHPPPYSGDRYKPHGSPLEYLSREVLKTQGAKIDEDRADTNVELLNNHITGVNVVVNGSGNVVSGNNVVITGNGNFVNEDNVVITGSNNRVTGHGNVVNGDRNDVSGNNNVVNGNGHVVTVSNQVIN